MRLFYEYWAPFLIRQPSAGELQSADSADLIRIDNLSLQNWQPVTVCIDREEFLSVSFSHHIEILSKTREVDEVLFYIHQTVLHKWDKLARKGILQGEAGGAIPVCELVLTRGGGLCYGQRVTIHSAP